MAEVNGQKMSVKKDGVSAPKIKTWCFIPSSKLSCPFTKKGDPVWGRLYVIGEGMVGYSAAGLVGFFY